MTSSRKLNILMVLRAPIGGLYRNVMDLTAELSRRGHQIGIVTDSTIEDAQTERRIKELPMPPALGVHRMPIPRLFGLSDFSSMRAIRHLTRELKIDVLHGHGAKGGLNARLSRIGDRHRVAIYTPHGGVLHYDLTSGVGRLLRFIERQLLNVSDAVVFESAYAKGEFEHQIGKVDCLAPIALNGLAPAEFDRLDPELADHDFAYVGELRTVKGLDVMLKALKQITRPDGAPATVIIAGKGPEEGALRSLAEQLGVSDQINFVGVQPAREVFGRGRCALMPSRIESLPYVALEASAAGRPLIATDVGGVKEIFGPTSSSLIAKDSVDALATAMQAYLDNPHFGQAEADQRYEFVRAHFSLTAMTDTVEQTYFEALNRR